MTRILLLIVAIIAVAGCGGIQTAIDDAIPEEPVDCRVMYAAARCEAMADVAAAEAGRTRADVAGLVIVPPPTLPRGTARSGSSIIVRAHFDDGTTAEATVCGGIPIGPACMDDPAIGVRSVTMGGYLDVPCPDDAESGTCGRPLPTLEPNAVADAQPLDVAALDVPIDHVGPFEIVVGDGNLANGILTDATLVLAEPWPSDLALTPDGIRIEVRSLEPDGLPFDNHYLHGWRPGVERFEAVLRFEVLWFEPGAELRVRDVVVR